MALLFCDNFQQYGTGASPSAMLDGIYVENSNMTIEDDPDPNITQSVLKIFDGNFATGTLRKVLPGSIAVGSALGVGFRIWQTSFPIQASDQACLLALRDGTNTDIVSIIARTDGYLDVYQGAGSSGANGTGTLVGSTTSPALVAGAWQQVEMKVVVHASAGSVEVRVDGVVKLNLTGVNTGNATTTQIVHQANGNSATTAEHTFYMKDYFIWDTTGSYNNDFIGNVFVHSMIPDGDVSGTWSVTGGGGTAFDAIDDSSPDDDTSYISSAWPAATAEVVTVSDLPPEATVVKGMMSLVHSKKTDGGTANLQVSLVSGTNTVDGTDRPITVAYTYWTDIFETDPDTSAAWTVAAANAVKLKLNRTA